MKVDSESDGTTAALRLASADDDDEVSTAVYVELGHGEKRIIPFHFTFFSCFYPLCFTNIYNTVSLLLCVYHRHRYYYCIYRRYHTIGRQVEQPTHSKEIMYSKGPCREVLIDISFR